MKDLVNNIPFAVITGIFFVPTILIIISIPMLRYFAGLLVFYLLLQVVLDGVAEEVRVEHQAKVDNRKQANKKEYT